MILWNRQFGSIKKDLSEIVMDFLTAPLSGSSCRILEQYPELLSEEANSMLNTLSENVQDEKINQAIKIRHNFLSLCRDVGMEEAFKRLTCFSTEKSINNLQMILEEISILSRPQEMPKKIKLIQQALSLFWRQSNPKLWALLQGELGTSLARNPQGNQAENIEQAIDHFNQALEVYTHHDNPFNWANIQNDLANSYLIRIRGDETENIEKAIEYYAQSLIVRTQKDLPKDWALTQSNLASAYSKRIRGDKEENIEKAIEYYKQALEVYTQKDFPTDWARVKCNLASAYEKCVQGDKAENIEKSIECCIQAFEIYTQKDFPEDWAKTQNTLGNAYWSRIKGDRAENIEKAIEHYNQALKVYTHKDFPVDWALNQSLLAITYEKCIRGSKAENIEQAIYHYNQALEVRTHKDFPVEWAGTLDSLASADRKRIRGDRAENIEKAIEHYNQVFEVFTRNNLPKEWSAAQNSLAIAYYDRIRGDKAENIEQAIYHYNLALEICTQKYFPVDWAATQNNLANAYCTRIRGDEEENIEKAIYYYNQALTVRTQKNFPMDWAGTLSNLASAYSQRIRGDRAENIEKAIDYYNQVLKVYVRQDFPVDWTRTQRSLAIAYYNRVRGEKADNLEKAIEYYNQVLEVYTHKDFPIDWAKTQNDLASAYKDRTRGDRVENNKKAIGYFHRALDVFKLELMPDDFRKTSKFLGDLYLDMGQWGDAADSYKGAIKAGNLLYHSGLSVESKTIEVGKNAETYQNATLAACRLSLATEALLILEEGKTLVLSESLRLKMKKPTGVPNDEWIEYEKAADNYGNATKLSDCRENYAQREKKAQEALNKLNNAVKIIQSYNTEFQKELEISDILSTLDIETALLTFCITNKGSVGFVVSRSRSVQFVDISNFKKEDLDNLLFNLDKQEEPKVSGWVFNYWRYLNVLGTEHYESDFQVFQKTVNDVLFSIGLRLLYPLIAELPPQIKKLIIVPTSGLFLLPLHAVPLPNGQPLCQRYCISYAPSIQLLKEMQTKINKVEGKGLYAVINPQEDPSLIFSKYEGQVISNFFQSPQMNVGEIATKATVLARIPERTYIHFSCHGSYNWNDPLQSGLYLVGGRILSLADLQNDVVDMSSVRLVTLSACETGITDILKGSADEFVGLPAGFMLAGVPCVVSSLWSVPDISTALLMERFYSNHIVGGMDIPVALQEAQLWVRDLNSKQVSDYVEKCYLSGKWEGKSKEIIEQDREHYIKMAEESPEKKPFKHPYYWAAFTVNGA